MKFSRELSVIGCAALLLVAVPGIAAAQSGLAAQQAAAEAAAEQAKAAQQAAVAEQVLQQAAKAQAAILNATATQLKKHEQRLESEIANSPLNRLNSQATKLDTLERMRNESKELMEKQLEAERRIRELERQKVPASDPRMKAAIQQSESYGAAGKYKFAAQTLRAVGRFFLQAR